jgi:RNA polymerase sigma-70 factor (sigma-E family)
MSTAEFEEFVAASAAWLTRLAFTLTGERGAAEDLVQDALSRMYLRRSGIDDPRGYARRSLINLSKNRWRSLSRRREVPMSDGLGPVGPDSASTFAERDRVVRAVTQLPPQQRAVIVLRYLEDLSEADTAQLLGVTVGSVKTHTSRALSRLTALLTSGADDPAEPRTAP